MGITNFLSKSRGVKNLLARIASVLSRFGLTSGKFARMLTRFGEVSSELGCTPTFAITAVVLQRHPELISQLSRRGIEFAIHGQIHIDYGVVPPGEQAEHFSRAMEIFRQCHVPFTGFRAPFLRTTNQTLGVLGNLGIPYDSSRSVSWDAVTQDSFNVQSWREYQRLLDFYKSTDSCNCRSLPWSHNGIVEIPVSIPDDEALVERLGVTEKSQIGSVWQSILQSTYNRGEIFTLQLHPERIFLCESALADVVRQARQCSPAVWIATLKEVAAWWQERNKFTLGIIEESRNRYRIKAASTDRATILIKNCRTDFPADSWADGYHRVSVRDFVVESPIRPAIGIGPNVPESVVSFLNNEGYIVERSNKAENFGLYLDNMASFGKDDERLLISQVEQSGIPIVRFWRWPCGARSALSVTGDIDSITLVDFALRILENWRQNRKARQAEKVPGSGAMKEEYYY
jgi:hypothetical protein